MTRRPGRSDAPRRPEARGPGRAERIPGLGGRDLAGGRTASRRGSRLVPLALVGALVGGLGLAALRIDGIRQRYALAAAMREEKELLEERALLIAQVRRLRDPARLAKLADRMELRRPDRVIELPLAASSAVPRP